MSKITRTLTLAAMTLAAFIAAPGGAFAQTGPEKPVGNPASVDSTTVVQTVPADASSSPLWQFVVVALVAAALAAGIAVMATRTLGRQSPSRGPVHA